MDWSHVDNCGLLWCLYQLFGLWFWRHPFTANDPLVSKWCYVTVLQICSNEEINSSTSSMAWGWVHFSSKCSIYGELQYSFKENGSSMVLSKNVLSSCADRWLFEYRKCSWWCILYFKDQNILTKMIIKTQIRSHLFLLSSMQLEIFSWSLLFFFLRPQ